jgi:cyanophycinase
VHAFLIGGGRDRALARTALLPFADAVRGRDGRDVAVLVLDEGDETDVARWAGAIEDVDLVPNPIVVAPGKPPGELSGVGGVFVAGGLTPGYQESLCADPSWLPRDSTVYAGFSAGAAIAARRALVGGWRADGVPVCDENAGEDLDEIELLAGLGLLEAVVDVHCAQWGTLTRLVHAVARGAAVEGWGIDEHTTLEVRDGRAIAVHGHGAAWHATVHQDGGVSVLPRLAGPL